MTSVDLVGIAHDADAGALVFEDRVEKGSRIITGDPEQVLKPQLLQA